MSAHPFPPTKFAHLIGYNFGIVLAITFCIFDDHLLHFYFTKYIRIRSDESKLPRWLGSGISSFTSEIFFSRNVVSKDTIEFLCLQNKNKDLNNYNTVYPHVLGYWTVRYLEENYPGFLKKIFKRYKGEEIVDQIRLQLGLSQENFWDQLDELLYENYKHLLDNK